MGLLKWVQTLLRDRIWPAIKLQFGINPQDLWLQDCFLVKYEAAGQAGLDSHCDDSELSFNLLLSDPASFEGGGTAFTHAEPEELTVQPAQGEVITQFGIVSHEAKPIVKGTRYILAGFVRAAPLAKLWREMWYQSMHTNKQAIWTLNGTERVRPQIPHRKRKMLRIGR
eukprot:gnl/TRDRNA2_/TRDRNA2_133072_c1_seq2.p1 gnl/TRDRNA2_/TRDRNA2_133072_c1~~gnl/TRDRNA2_/TRDRNA2_133072_c1_seq2.p1  ORF type:complete len:169 (+),score=19.92 gnl/TRDRNA2_/TRDRNA2_133072_c1_seq2:154-660(+)